MYYTQYVLLLANSMTTCGHGWTYCMAWGLMPPLPNINSATLTGYSSTKKILKLLHA